MRHTLLEMGTFKTTRLFPAHKLYHEVELVVGLTTMTLGINNAIFAPHLMIPTSMPRKHDLAFHEGFGLSSTWRPARRL